MILRFLALSLTTLLLSCTALNEDYDIPYDATMVSAGQEMSTNEDVCLIDINRCAIRGAEEGRRKCEAIVDQTNRSCSSNP